MYIQLVTLSQLVARGVPLQGSLTCMTTICTEDDVVFFFGVPKQKADSACVVKPQGLSWFSCSGLATGRSICNKARAKSRLL